MGKKVPLNRNIGKMNINVGTLKVSIFGTNAVVISPNEAKSSPPRIATGIITRPRGKGRRLKNPTMIDIIKAAMTDFVAPHSSSPAITSSGNKGVAMMASNVFW